MKTDQLSHEDRCCVLCLACTPEIGPVTIRQLISYAARNNCSLREALEKVKKSNSLLSSNAFRQFKHTKNPAAAGQRLMDSLARQDIAVVFADDQRYPEDLHGCLGRSAPPLIFMAGNHNAVRRPRLAVVGSRRPSRTGKRAARSFASKHAKAGTCIVSGGARGIDLTAHRAAMLTGVTVVVPPTGLLRFRWRQTQKQLANNSSWCILGLFPPDSGWHDRNALIRNRAIVALSRAVFAIEPRDKGGTWHSCNTALELGKPLFITSGRRNGPYQRSITSLTKRGAIWIESNAIPEPEEFFKMVEKTREQRYPQKGLFDSEKCPRA